MTVFQNTVYPNQKKHSRSVTEQALLLNKYTIIIVERRYLAITAFSPSKVQVNFASFSLTNLQSFFTL